MGLAEGETVSVNQIWQRLIVAALSIPLACAARSMVRRPTCRRIRLQVDRLAYMQSIRSYLFPAK